MKLCAWGLMSLAALCSAAQQMPVSGIQTPQPITTQAAAGVSGSETPPAPATAPAIGKVVLQVIVDREFDSAGQMVSSEPPHSQTAPAEQKQSENPPSESGPVYKAGGGVLPPRPIKQRDPDYPNSARRSWYEAKVILWLVVGPDGMPRNIKFQRTELQPRKKRKPELEPELEKAFGEQAMAAVRRWRFDPATKDGNPVAVQINVEVNFRLY